jgi:hypothetical protein
VLDDVEGNLADTSAALTPASSPVRGNAGTDGNEDASMSVRMRGRIMKIRHIFTADTVVAILFGAGLLVTPGGLLLLLGIPPTPTEGGLALFERLLGAALVGIGATEWLSRKASDLATMPIVRGMLAFDVIALVVCVQAVASGTVNALAWLVVALFLFFAMARTYFGFVSAEAGLKSTRQSTARVTS